MHVLNLLNMMKAVQGREFSHAFIFDHDLLFHRDFVAWFLANHAEADVCGCLLDDVNEPRVSASDDSGELLTYHPKISVWHLGMSRRFFDKVVEVPDAMFPVRQGKEIYDTFARGLKWAREDWGMLAKVLPQKEFAEVVTHWWSASLNFGYRFDKDYCNRILRLESMYDQMFPQGIGHLLEKVKK